MIKGFRDSDIINAKNKSARLKNSLEVYFREALNLQKSGELIKASKIYDLLIQNNYDHEDILINYANICQKLNEDNKAILLFKKSISKNPKNFIPFFKMGFILNNNGRYFEALEFAKKAIELKPELWQGHHNLIKIFRNLNRPHEALEITKNASRLFLKNHLFSGLLGDIYSEIGRFEDAEKNYKRAIELAPNNDEAIYGYVNFTMGIGDKKISIDLLKKIIKINKYHSMSYYSLSRLVNLEEEKSIKEKIVKFDINVFKDNYNKYNILFSKSHIYHRLKDYKKSAENLVKANELKLIDKPSNIKKVLALSNNILDKTSNDKSYALSYFKNLRDIFIVGLPRSGSTLVESILGINNDVYNLGETSIFMNVLVESRIRSLTNFNNLYNKYTSYYTDKKFTTNKTLSNFMYTPYILTKMNYSKIIYTYRNPLDNILSMYRAKFTGLGNEYSSSIIDSAMYYINHFKIMKFYKEKYPEGIYFLNYDSMVNNPEKEIRSLINWLGWTWDENFLYPYKSKQAFYTASNVQVRSPINNKSVGGWKKYEGMLKKAKDYFINNNFQI